MRDDNRVLAAIRENYTAIMSANNNPLRMLPVARRFQAMVYLSAMWTSFFCARFGAWHWYGEPIAGHVLVVPGNALTTVTFRSASRRGVDSQDGAE